MRILILAHALRAGGGRATCINILTALRKLDRRNEYCILVPDHVQYRNMRLEGSRCEIHYYRRRFGHFGRWAFDRIRLKGIAARFQPDLVWAMGGLGFIEPPCPQIVSVQNPYIMYGRKHWGRLRCMDFFWVFFVRRVFKKQLKNTQMVICQTAIMEKRLRESYDYQGKTLVTGKAISEFSERWSGKVPQALKSFRNSFKLLYITRYYPHKGLEILVETLDRYREELDDITLFITIEPEQHPNAARLLKVIQAKSLEDRIINLGRLPQNELAAYYRNCDALLMPTRMESFSGTYLESMHFGLPILTSDFDFAREVCGDAALYFDPWDVASIRDSVLLLKGSPEKRKELVAKGKRRLSQNFTRSWDDIAITIKKSLESLIVQTGPTGGSS